MFSKTLTFLALSSLALAHPRRHSHFHFGTGTGASGMARPTGGAFPMNGTDSGAGSPVESPAAVTRTVIPIASPTVDAENAFSSPPAVGQVAASDTEVAPVDASSTTCTSSSTSTVFMTSTEYFTVTADAAAAASSPAEKPDSIAGLQTPASSVSLVSSDSGTPSVSAGAFYGQSRSYGGAGSSAAPATTFATMPSAAAPPAGSSAAVDSSAAAPTASTVPSTGGGSGGKKGLSYNTASLLNAFSGTGMSWAYNWGAGPDGTLPSGVEYVPMCWGLNSVAAWPAAAAKAIAAGSTHVLSFNEPDLGTQSNMSPEDAATNHIKYMNPLFGQVKIGSPAITNGGTALMGVEWMKAFFKACNGQCKIDFVAFHWYDSASNLPYFESHVQTVIDLARLNKVDKVWCTEFGASGSDSDVASFITSASTFLDSKVEVERYAYFMVSDGILVKGNSLSTLGQAYAA